MVGVDTIPWNHFTLEPKAYEGPWKFERMKNSCETLHDILHWIMMFHVVDGFSIKPIPQRGELGDHKTLHSHNP